MQRERNGDNCAVTGSSAGEVSPDLPYHMRAYFKKADVYEEIKNRTDRDRA